MREQACRVQHACQAACGKAMLSAKPLEPRLFRAWSAAKIWAAPTAIKSAACSARILRKCHLFEADYAGDAVGAGEIHDLGTKLRLSVRTRCILRRSPLNLSRASASPPPSRFG